MVGFPALKGLKLKVYFVQGSLALLHEDLGTDILPPEYGGTNMSVKELTGYTKLMIKKN
jgi:hypothetical protein